MQPAGYSPYTTKGHKKESRFRLPNLSGGFKKWLIIILAVLFGLFVIFYLLLGELRFFANNYLRLTFFSKNYLILLQNNYEVRPSGGFITAYGTLDTLFGFPTNLSFNNSYEIDTDTYVMPPYPHEELLKNEWYEGYTFRDANWNPNFPEAAVELIGFYQNKFPDRDVDGMIVVNFSMIENLVEKLGSITVNGISYTEDTLFSAITDTVNDIDRHNEEALASRKNILSDLSGILISKAKWHPFKVKEVVIEALHNKDLYFWFDSGLQRKVVKKGWANALEPTENSDFLAVNIANLGSKKADRYIYKEVYHYVNITKELPEITTEIVIRYPGFKNTYADDYKGYLQLVIPGEANVNTDLMDSRVTDSGSFKIIGEQIILPAGSKTTLAYTYTLPRNHLNVDEYRLRLIRQSGDEKYVWITVEAPADRLIKSDDFETRENRAIFADLLTNDLDLSLNLLPDTASPYPIEQVFDNVNTISIYWNEPIDQATGNDALNYVITDTNQTNSAITDEVNVTYAEIVDASVSKLEIEGVTLQNLERYQIELKNIRDNSGNTIDPDPKFITVVQRDIGEEETTSEP
ncbi:DUF4012 domain-containing protein [Patescibacteria group bacterium]|nr:DUF4012 domain-containing protein [Patescibacteria group bacterium]MBU1682976.1 DUF4012 domain-containing protein [Patescibacteria group bacterium]MBU1935206.1 DUF4012 domain-containing protein [Patescibacteria group bacterium]